MKIRLSRWLTAAVAAVALAPHAGAVQPDKKNLPIGLAPHEVGMQVERDAPMTDPPEGHVRSLAEWEEAEAAMTLWTNPSLVRALAEHGAVRLFADTRNDKGWWESWLENNGISSAKVSYFTVPTDSIWIRDYGPWFILDGNGVFGIVDTKYNRPRPKDDVVPEYIAKELGLPLYQPGLVHTGGNYYNDGQDNAFSSTLVYSENSSLAKAEVDERMRKFLGIERYTTSKLAPKMTIEHMDTFGKLVAPDTWVFSEFPEGSRYRADSEAYVQKLRGLKSPYGTEYKIFRLKMRPVSGNPGERFRAYINSFISNHALYYPKYGDAIDDEVKAVYQKALPGYDIVGVDAMGTEWGDSVHCRNRNLLKKDTTFLFPTADPRTREIRVETYPVPSTPPCIAYEVEGKEFQCEPMAFEGNRNWRIQLKTVTKGAKVKFHVVAYDARGQRKTAPLVAPEMRIEFTAQ